MCLKKLVFIIIYLLLSAVLGISAKRSRIYGGSKALIRDFPHLVSFRTLYNKHFCAGSIISNRHILSAAHCFLDYLNEYYRIKIHTGSTYLSGTSKSILHIEKISIHPEFKWRLLTLESPYDICIIEVKEEIQFNEFQNKINLPSRDVFDENIGIIVGWGALLHDRQGISDVLLKAPATFYRFTTCSEITPFHVFNDQFCSFNSNQIGTCKGDSGGSVISNGEIYGIISTIHECTNGLPDVHTKVYTYLDFIRSIIDN